MKKAHLFLNKAEQEQLIQAIQDAELNTSGEIRVHIENTCKGNAFQRAKEVFESLNMHQTAQKNGVLFYLALQTKDFVIIGDKGINDCVPSNFWEDIKNLTINHFKSQEFALGLTKSILLCGEKLKEFFPYQSSDVNELSDDISFGD